MLDLKTVFFLGKVLSVNFFWLVKPRVFLSSFGWLRSMKAEPLDACPNDISNSRPQPEIRRRKETPFGSLLCFAKLLSAEQRAQEAQPQGGRLIWELLGRRRVTTESAREQRYTTTPDNGAGVWLPNHVSSGIARRARCGLMSNADCEHLTYRFVRILEVHGIFRASSQLRSLLMSQRTSFIIGRTFAATRS